MIPVAGNHQMISKEILTLRRTIAFHSQEWKFGNVYGGSWTFPKLSESDLYCLPINEDSDNIDTINDETCIRENEEKYKILGGPNNLAIDNFPYWYKKKSELRITFFNICTMLTRYIFTP